MSFSFHNSLHTLIAINPIINIWQSPTLPSFFKNLNSYYCMHRILSNGENQSCQVPTVSAYTCGGIKLVQLYFARLDIAKQPLVLGHICYFRNIILLTLIMAEHIQTLNNALMKFNLCIAECILQTKLSFSLHSVCGREEHAKLVSIMQ